MKVTSAQVEPSQVIVPVCVASLSDISAETTVHLGKCNRATQMFRILEERGSLKAVLVKLRLEKKIYIVRKIKQTGSVDNAQSASHQDVARVPL